MCDFEKLLKIFDKGWYWQYFYRMRLKWYFCSSFSKRSNFGFSWKKKWGFSDKKAWIFCQIWLICQVWYTISLKLCFYSRIFKMFRFWILSEKNSEFFKNAIIHRKLSASRNVLMLKGSQTFKFGFFWEKKMFFFGKKAW